MENNNIWLASYLYYTEPWEHLLTDAVIPFVNRAFQENWIEQFFFIRYWEHGPHIRLRFKGEKQKLEDKLRPEILTFFSNHFQKYSSNRNDSDSTKKLPPSQQWFPNNSIQFINYEPEIGRYGGPIGILIAEEHFETSSRTVLHMIDESPEWNYERALGSAIQLHLAFASSVGMDLIEAKHFFYQIFKWWFYHVFHYSGNLSAVELTKRKTETLNAFMENFKKQKLKLLSFSRTLWDALEDKITFDQDWYNRCLAEIRVTGQKLRNAQINNKLIFPNLFSSDRKIDIPEDRQMLWSIYGSYVHMSNNRLGILNRDEAYLGYLLKECLENM